MGQCSLLFHERQSRQIRDSSPLNKRWVMAAGHRVGGCRKPAAFFVLFQAEGSELSLSPGCSYGSRRVSSLWVGLLEVLLSFMSWASPTSSANHVPL
jgi:hypothetical protein